MRKIILSLFIVLASGVVIAQEAREMEFDVLPCTEVGSITADGRVCTKKDVDEYIKRGSKIMTAEEKKIESLSKKKDPLGQKQAIQKRSKGIWAPAN